MERKELGQLLVDKGILNPQQLEDILVLQRQTKKYLGEILVERGYVTRDLILEALTEQRKADLVKLSKLKGIKQEIVRLIPEHIARRYGILVIAKEEDHIVLAMKDATDIVAIDTVRRLTGMNVRVVRAAEDEIQDNIERHYLEGGDLTQTLADLEAERGEDDDEFDVNQLKVAAEDAPIIRFVNSLFMQAVEKRSTDIHLEPQETSVSLRFRIDGDLHHFPPPLAPPTRAS